MDSKRRQSLRNDKNSQDLDRISQLPDRLLVHILSNLSTKDAVATTILSKRWMNLWIDLPILEFEWDIELLMTATEEDCDRKKVSFKNFVNRVLLLHRASYVTSCRFSHLSEFDSADTDAWFSALSTRQVREIIFEHCHIDLAGPFSTKSRFKLFTIESLSVLDLSSVFIEYTRKVVKFCLPNLKTLRLYKVTCFNKDFIKRLLAGCRVLQDLAIFSCNFNSIEIHSSTLSTFSLSNFGPLDSLILDGPNLKELYLCSEDLYIAEVFSGVDGIFRTSTSYLDYHDVPSEVDFENLPWFRNLTCLQLKAFSDLKLGFVLGMLNHCPNLQNLILHFDCDIHKRDWMLPESVPHCLSSSLKEFELCVDDLRESDVDILKYFLKNGMAMEEMKLQMYSKEKCDVLKKLLMPHRASSSCRITFTSMCFH